MSSKDVQVNETIVHEVSGPEASSSNQAQTQEQGHEQLHYQDSIIQKPRSLTFLKTPRFWIVLVLGQVLSLCIVSTNTFTTKITDEGYNFPAFQTFFNYIVLLLIYTIFTFIRIGFRGWWNMIKKDGWKFFLLAFADVEGNYFVVKAFQYTNLLSAQLLDNWAIIVVVILSYFFLKVRYHWTQFLGGFICLIGMALLVVSDRISNEPYAGSDLVKGDLFMILGATFYGISNVLEEYLVSTWPLYVTVGQIGFWGVIINGIQCAIFERHTIAGKTLTRAAGGWLAGYNISMFILYSGAPILFRMSSAAFFNLSLLTSDFWGLIVGIELFGYSVFWLYPVAFVFTIGGLIIYNLFKRPDGEARKPWLGEDQSKGVIGVGTARRHGGIVVGEVNHSHVV